MKRRSGSRRRNVQGARPRNRKAEAAERIQRCGASQFARSALPPIWTSGGTPGMSAKGHKRTHAAQQNTSFVDLVGEQQHRLGDGQPERLGGF
jgi:hypothetical protein